MDKVFIVVHKDGALTIWGKCPRLSDHAEGAKLYAADESVRMIELLEWVSRGFDTRWIGSEGTIAHTPWALL